MNRVALDLGFINIYWYSIFILIGTSIGLILVLIEAKKQKIEKNFIIDLVLYSLPLSIIGARLYYVIFNWN